MVKSSSGQLKHRSSRHKKFSRRTTGDNLQLVWSVHPVMEALKTSPGIVQEIIVAKTSGTKIKKIIEMAEQRNVVVRHDKAWFQKAELADEERHQGVIARISYPYVSLSEMLLELQDSENVPFILALDSIQDTRNLGSIIRSAVAAGCKKLILPKDRSAQITGSVAKASAGAVFHVDVCRVTNLVFAFDALREAGIWIFGTAVDVPLSIYQADFNVPACLVIGNEEKGLRTLVKKNCDILVTIPMFSELDSMNASVAAGVVLFEMARQRAL
ncbi:23S rRNA (guanosine(2251)-2'-O)-methyltransferase RlmB [Thermodesulfobacteriota bacterium]